MFLLQHPIANTAQGCAAEHQRVVKNMVEQSSMEPLLLVEDKPELRAMLRKALERGGHKVEGSARWLLSRRESARAEIFAGSY